MRGMEYGLLFHFFSPPLSLTGQTRHRQGCQKSPKCVTDKEQQALVFNATREYMMKTVSSTRGLEVGKGDNPVKLWYGCQGKLLLHVHLLLFLPFLLLIVRQDEVVEFLSLAKEFCDFWAITLHPGIS